MNSYCVGLSAVRTWELENTDRLEGFELAGADRKLVRAEARVVGTDTMVIESPEVPQPVAVRYAWGAFPLCNLFNLEAFPAYPFRTDSWP